MNNLINTLQEHLSSSENHVVKIKNATGVKLSKDTPIHKYAFDLHYIESKYNSLQHFLSLLPGKGFKKDVVFTLQKMYGTPEKTTYHLVKEFKEDLEKESMNTPIQTSAQTYIPPTPSQDMFSSFLGAPGLMNKFVDAERSNDYKQQVEELKEEIRELKSENRILREKNSSLEIKLQTANDRQDLAIEKAKMESKGFFESPAFESLAGALPDVAKAIMGGQNVNSGALGSPVTQIQKSLFNKIQSENTEEQKIAFLIYLLENWKEGIDEEIVEILEK
ncbi:hypothetical protein ACQY1Q_06060 [Tenacibaculum sp. TC6]|uniref:hypothetical protein n=1 Tax=Tenacibaculum sp. TC6 TaxID=3423223 RepID=UPI003D36FB15